jgi:hypothetical protein
MQEIRGNINNALAIDFRGKKIKMQTTGSAVSVLPIVDRTLSDLSNCLIMNNDQECSVRIPLDQELKDNECYVLSFEYLTNFEDSNINSTKLITERIINSESTKSVYYQFCSYDNSILPDNQWHSINIPVIASKKMSRLEIEFGNTAKGKYFCLRNVLLRLDSSELSKLNLIPNGDFEWNCIVPEQLFNGAEDCLYWQRSSQIAPRCIETRDGVVKNRGSKDQRSYHDSIYTGFLTILGSADINCSNQYAINGGVIAYHGRYYGRLCVSKNDTPKDNHTIPGEYFQVELKQQLRKGSKYEFSLAYMHDPTSPHFTNNLAVKFTCCAFSMVDKQAYKHQFATCDFLISDSIIMDSSWTHRTFLYTARGDENFITIGPFVSNQIQEQSTTVKVDKTYSSAKGYYLIDDLELREK